MQMDDHSERTKEPPAMVEVEQQATDLSSSHQPTSKYGLDWKFCKRLHAILSHVLFPSTCSVAALILYCLLLCAAAEQVFIYYIGLIPSKFYAVLIPKDAGGFRVLAVNSVLFIVGKAVVAALLSFCSALLYITWRQLLNRRLHALYFHGRAKCYYFLNIYSCNDFVLDNPDQRMTQDVDKFCLQLSSVVAPVVAAPFKIAWYTYQTFLVTGIYGPLAIFGYFVVGTVINKFLMSPIIRYVYEQERKEGDFRYKHMQVRIYAESIAFYRSERIEYVLVNQKLSSLLRILLVKARWQSLLNFSLGVFDYFGGILSFLLLAIPLFAGKYDSLTPDKLSELISKNGFVCIMLVSSFSTLVDLAQQASEIAGNLHRVAQIKEVMDDRCGRTERKTSTAGANRRRFRGNSGNDVIVSSDDDENDDNVDARRRLMTPVGNSVNVQDNVPPPNSPTISNHSQIDPLSITNVMPTESFGRSATASPVTAAELTSLTASTFCSVLGTPTSTVTDLIGPNYAATNSTKQLPYLSFELCNISFGIPEQGTKSSNSSHSSLLVRHLSLLIQRGCNVLVSGPSSSGKTSLLRVLLNIWPLREGRVLCRYGSNGNDSVSSNATVLIDAASSRNRRLKNRLVMCLPQKSLLTDGSLKQQLVYPELVLDHNISNATRSSAAGEGLVDLLRYVRMEHLLHGESSRIGGKSAADGEWRRWEDILSPGEQQRLSFIRVYYHRPQFVFLDEATSAVEPAMEERLYAKVRQFGITMLSVGHRESLRQYHDIELKLDGKGGWAVVSLGNDLRGTTLGGEMGVVSRDSENKTGDEPPGDQHLV